MIANHGAKGWCEGVDKPRCLRVVGENRSQSCFGFNSWGFASDGTSKTDCRLIFWRSSKRSQKRNAD